MNRTVSVPRPPLIVSEWVPEIVKLWASARSTLSVGSRSRIWIVPEAPGPTLIRSLSAVSVLPPGSAPLNTTSMAVISIGSRPAYWIVLPSTVIEPECAPLGFDTTLVPETARESKPPAPPSTVPLIEPVDWTTKLSLLSAAPVRFSTEVKATPATLPAFGPVTSQTTSLIGPTSVSFPRPGL